MQRLMLAFASLLLLVRTGAYLPHRVRRLQSPLWAAGFALVSSQAGEDDKSSAAAASQINRAPDSPCPCGSGATYGDCCLPYHSHALQLHDPVALIRARYSAYALENIDFILDTTSTASPDYLAYIESPVGARSGRKKWAKDVRKNMVDSFAYVRMEVEKVEQSPEGPNGGDEATVYYRHLAISKLENTMYPIEETAYCSKDKGVWFFEAATVQRPEADVAQKIMEEWPVKAGIKLVGSGAADEGSGSDEPSAPPPPAERPPRAPRPRRAPPSQPGGAAPPTVRSGKRG